MLQLTTFLWLSCWGTTLKSALNLVFHTLTFWIVIIWSRHTQASSPGFDNMLMKSACENSHVSRTLWGGIDSCKCDACPMHSVLWDFIMEKGLPCFGASCNG